MSRHSLSEAVAHRLDQLVPPDCTVLLAVSGGRDSLALLHLLATTREIHQRGLMVGHVDHGIAPDSASVATLVVEQAARLGVLSLTTRLELGPAASETTARRARRRALRELARQAGAAAIALAHHADDQVETVMLRVLKGSGPAGLAGMAPRRGPWIRPLLEIDPALLHRHLDTTGLSHWQDPANSDPRHLRSWLRTVALPLLEEGVPELRRSVSRLAQHAAAERTAWNQVLELLPDLDLERSGRGISVAAAALSGYRSAVQHAVISALGRRLGVPIGLRGRQRVIQLATAARSGSSVALGSLLEAEVAFGRLILRRQAAAGFAAVALSGPGQFAAGEFQLVAAGGTAPELLEREGWNNWFASGEYLVRPWQQGDRIRPLGGQGSRTVADLFKEARIAARERRGWPVMVRADDPATIIWVPGICRADASLPVNGKEALVVRCHRG